MHAADIPSACLVGVGEEVLVQALAAPLEGAVAQGDQPQQQAHGAAGRRQRPRQVQQVCRAACAGGGLLG